jgi:hypothetical protein
MPDAHFPIEWSHILMFVRSIGDQNPVYRDPATAVAPPTFVTAGSQFNEDYFLRWRPDRPWMGSGKDPSGYITAANEAAEAAKAAPDAAAAPVPAAGAGGGGGGLHAEQHYVYHRPIRPGDVLVPGPNQSGRTWEKEGRRGGKLRFSESVTEYRDQNGELVVTTTSVGVATERVPEQG